MAHGVAVLRAGVGTGRLALGSRDGPVKGFPAARKPRRGAPPGVEGAPSRGDPGHTGPD